MELSKKQSQIFADWYLERYAKKDEVWEYITPVEIPDVLADKQDEDIKDWARIIYKMLGKNKAKSVYKYRTYFDWTTKKETWFEKTFNSLFLQYWPRYVNEDWTIAKSYKWLNDVIDLEEFLKTWKI